MFAKVFGQIFDSSIAEDYNCRRMFMDLLVLADSDGVVDMTHEAISRRTNVPMEEVRKYIEELQQPDPMSRSKLEEGKRIIQIDSQRDWGWQIVNYSLYRRIRDEEVRRSYFRDAQRRYRKRLKKVVKDTVLTHKTPVDNLSPPASASSSTSSSLLSFKWAVWATPKFQSLFDEWMSARRAMGKKPKNWHHMFQKQLDWIAQFGLAGATESLNQSIRNNWQGLFEPGRKDRRSFGDRPPTLDKSKIEVPERFKAWVAEHYPNKREEAMKWQTWADVPPLGLREEWWKEEKAKLPVQI